jgi:2-C-methyl-D-erythritol 4-phosphate cytidylyltransferase
MGEGCSKQMARVCSIPVVAHTLIAFQQAEHIHEIVVAAKKDELPLYESMAKIYGITKFSTAVIGGKTRQESVENAFAKIKDRAKFVAIADGARCLITPDDIDRVCNAAYLYGAATAAQKASDSVKIGDKNDFISSSPDRSTVWLAQTPQIFKVNLYRAALYSAKEDGASVTDDNMLVERIRANVKLVQCSRENIKITEPSDLLFAEAVLGERMKNKDKEK